MRGAAGAGAIGDTALASLHVAVLDAGTPDRGVSLSCPAGATEPFRVMLFAGKRLNQPIAWRGPFVMCTDAEIRDTIQRYHSGAFPPKRVPWDYRTLAAFPAPPTA